MKPHAVPVVAFVAVLGAFCASSAAAQSFVQYRCTDGAQVAAMFPEKQRRVFLQLDGKSLTLPQRLSASGARYAKDGIVFWIKGRDAQLKRPKRKPVACTGD